MSEKKENFGKKFETKKSIGKKLISIYSFGYMINIGVFGRFRAITRDLIKNKNKEIFYPKKSSQDFPLLMKNMVEKHFKGKRDLIILEKSGEDDTFFELIKNFIDNFNFENFIEFENRYALIYYFSELDIYLFRCFKFILNKNPDIWLIAESPKEIRIDQYIQKNIKSSKQLIEEYSENPLEGISLSKLQIRGFLNKLAGEEACQYTGLTRRCGGEELVYARKILNSMKIPKKEQDLFLEKCKEYGGCCDCEILMNAAQVLLKEETPW